MATLMSLGDILFYRPTLGGDGLGFETVTRRQTAAVPAQQRLSRDNAVQFTGPGEETISIHGRAFPYHFGGVSTLQALGDALRAGQPLLLMQFNANLSNLASAAINGYYDGTRIGNYMIRDFAKESVLITSDGVPMKVDFTLELVLYGDDLNTPNFTPTTDQSDPNTGQATTSQGSQATATMGSATTPTTPTATATPGGTQYNLWAPQPGDPQTSTGPQ